MLAVTCLAACGVLSASDSELPRLLLVISAWSGLFLIALFLGPKVAVLLSKLLWKVFRWLFSWRVIKRCLIASACLAVLVTLFYAEENWRGRRAWDSFKREWEAKGESFDFASFVPPPVPDDQNFALTPIVASCYSRVLDRNGHAIVPQNTNILNRIEMGVYRENDYGNTNMQFGSWQKGKLTNLKPWQEYYRSSAILTNEFPVAPQPPSPAADVLLALSRYDSAIEELRQASRLPGSRFPLSYDKEYPYAYAILLPHLAALKKCALVLELRAIAELQNEQSGMALDDVKLSLRLTDSIRTEPTLISHLVRIAFLNLAIQPVWEGLTEHKWSSAQLAELDRELARLDFLSDLQFSMRGERAFALGEIDNLEKHRSYREVAGFFSVLKSDGATDTVNALAFYLMPSGWFYQNKLVISQIHQQGILQMTDPGKHLASPQSVRVVDKSVSLLLLERPWNFLAGMLLPALSATGKKYAFAQGSVDLARVACVLERYRLAHGQYPETLDTLAPQFIAKLPHDVISGQPLKYRRTEDGQFVLYSVGWNETDDGGTVDLKPSGRSADIEKGDWVWFSSPR